MITWFIKKSRLFLYNRDQRVVKSRSISFPALEEMIKRMSSSELIVLSGFLSAGINEHLQSMIAAVREWSDEEGGVRKHAEEIQVSLRQLVDSVDCLTLLIRVRLREQSGQGAWDAEPHQRMREKLRQAFPWVEFDP